MARTKNQFNAITARKSESEKIRDPKIYNVALYARISVMMPGKNDNSVDNQISIMKSYITNHPELNNYREYIDEGYSGTNFSRPEFKRLMNDIRHGNINCVCVKDLSRFGRDYLETGNYIETIFPFLDVRFISVNDHFDTDEKYNENKTLEISLKNLVNDMYAKDISKKLSITRRSEMERGRFTGSNAPYGYKINEESQMRQFIIDEPAAEVVREIFRMASEGITLRKISMYLQDENISIPGQYLKTGHFYQDENDEKKKWHIGTISNILKNQAYIGHLIQGKKRTSLCDNERRHDVAEEEWIVCEDAHEAIVSKELFLKVRKILENKVKDSTFTSNRGKDIPIKEDKYSRLIYCGNCGKKLSFQSSIVDKKGKLTRTYYYQCSNNYDAVKKESCCVRITEKCLDEKMLEAIKSQVKQLTNKDKTITNLEKIIASKMKNFDDKITKINKQIKVEEDKASDDYEDYVMGDLSSEEFKTLQARSTSRIIKLKSEIRDIDNEKHSTQKQLEEKLSFIKSMYSVEKLKNIDEKIIRTLINKIEIDSNSIIGINFKFSYKGDEHK